jgi:hypothetical protein
MLGSSSLLCIRLSVAVVYQATSTLTMLKTLPLPPRNQTTSL